MTNFILNQIDRLKEDYYRFRLRRRWQHLRSMGMKLGKGINMPMSTWIDTAHCFLISIGDNCGFGEGCAILAHDAMPNEYIDATKIAKVTIYESCHFGMRTIIMPGVKIGPRSIIGSNSVVINDIPAETVAAGNPAKVICSLEEYLNRHREWMRNAPLFPYKKYSYQYLNPATMKELLDGVADGFGYITEGYTAMVENDECLVRTD